MGVSRLNRTAGAIPGLRSKKSFFFSIDARVYFRYFLITRENTMKRVKILRLNKQA